MIPNSTDLFVAPELAEHSISCVEDAARKARSSLQEPNLTDEEPKEELE